VDIDTFVGEKISRIQGKDPSPGFERDFCWIGNVLAGDTDGFGQGRNLADHEFRVQDVHLRSLDERGMYKVLTATEARTDYPRDPGEYETHDLEKLHPDHPQVGCKLGSPPLTPVDVGLHANIENEG